MEKSGRSYNITLVLTIFLGNLGIHRFYTGKIGTGILYLLTLGFGGFGVLVDIFMLLNKSFKDKEGRYVTYEGSIMQNPVNLVVVLYFVVLPVLSIILRSILL